MFIFFFALGFAVAYLMLGSQQKALKQKLEEAESVIVTLYAKLKIKPEEETDYDEISYSEPTLDDQKETASASRHPDASLLKSLPKTDNLLVLFYVGAFLVLAAAFAFISFNWAISWQGFKTLILIFVTISFAIAGLRLSGSKRLRTAGLVYLSIALLFIPLDGIAFYNFGGSDFFSAAAVCFFTSIIFALACFTLYRLVWKNNFIFQLIILAILSTTLSLVNLLQLSHNYYFSASILLGYLCYYTSFLFTKKYPHTASLLDLNSYLYVFGGVFLGFIANRHTFHFGLTQSWPLFAFALSLCFYFIWRFHQQKDDFHWLASWIASLLTLALFFALYDPHHVWLWGTSFVLVSYGLNYPAVIATLQRKKHTQRTKVLRYLGGITLALTFFAVFSFYFSFTAIPWFFYFAIAAFLPLQYYLQPHPYWFATLFFWSIFMIWIAVTKYFPISAIWLFFLWSNLLSLIALLLHYLFLTHSSQSQQRLYLFCSLIFNFSLFLNLHFIRDLPLSAPATIAQLFLALISIAATYFLARQHFPQSVRNRNFLLAAMLTAFSWMVSFYLHADVWYFFLQTNLAGLLALTIHHFFSSHPDKQQQFAYLITAITANVLLFSHLHFILNLPLSAPAVITQLTLALFNIAAYYHLTYRSASQSSSTHLILGVLLTSFWWMVAFYLHAAFWFFLLGGNLVSLTTLFLSYSSAPKATPQTHFLYPASATIFNLLLFSELHFNAQLPISAPAALTQLTLALVTIATTYFLSRHHFPRSPQTNNFFLGALLIGFWWMIALYLELSGINWYLQIIFFYLFGWLIYLHEIRQNFAHQNATAIISLCGSAFTWYFAGRIGNYSQILGDALALITGLTGLFAGYRWRDKATKAASCVIIVTAVLIQTGAYLLLIPWYIWLAVLGLGILALATYLLQHKDN